MQWQHRKYKILVILYRERTGRVYHGRKERNLFADGGNFPSTGFYRYFSAYPSHRSPIPADSLVFCSQFGQTSYLVYRNKALSGYFGKLCKGPRDDSEGQDSHHGKRDPHHDHWLFCDGPGAHRSNRFGLCMGFPCALFWISGKDHSGEYLFLKMNVWCASIKISILWEGNPWK